MSILSTIGGSTVELNLSYSSISQNDTRTKLRNIYRPNITTNGEHAIETCNLIKVHFVD